MEVGVKAGSLELLVLIGNDCVEQDIALDDTTREAL